MEVTLKGLDGNTISATIQPLRAYPMLLWWMDSMGTVPHRYFVRDGSNVDGHYTETRPEPILTLGGVKSG